MPKFSALRAACLGGGYSFPSENQKIFPCLGGGYLGGFFYLATEGKRKNWKKIMILKNNARCRYKTSLPVNTFLSYHFS